MTQQTKRPVAVPERDHAREKRMLDMRRLGWTQAEIAEAYHISRQRVSQILARLREDINHA
jgi:transcriptional regulator